MRKREMRECLSACVYEFVRAVFVSFVCLFSRFILFIDIYNLTEMVLNDFKLISLITSMSNSIYFTLFLRDQMVLLLLDILLTPPPPINRLTGG